MELPQTYQPGDTVFDENAGAMVQILEKLEAWGFVSYRVFNASSGRVYKASPEQLRQDSGSQIYDESYLHYVTLLAKIKNETAGMPVVTTFLGPSLRGYSTIRCALLATGLTE